MNDEKKIKQLRSHSDELSCATKVTREITASRKANECASGNHAICACFFETASSLKTYEYISMK